MENVSIYKQLEEIILSGDEQLITHLSPMSIQELTEYMMEYESRIMLIKRHTNNQETIAKVDKNMNLIRAYYQLAVLKESDKTKDPGGYILG